MARFELKIPVGGETAPGVSRASGLGDSLLLENARWFTRIRWWVVCGFGLFGLTGAVLPQLPAAAGLVPQGWWPIGAAAALAVANWLSMLHLRKPPGDRSHPAVSGNIRAQIVTDLLLLTVVVHAAGALGTFIAFAYLFHIVLACIFFAPRESFQVTVLATLLFLNAVLLEQSGILPARGILAGGGAALHGAAAVFQAASAVFVWLVVWYLASTISARVRQRDAELDIANQRLRKADDEKNMQVLRVTHDLKAPFSGIESNIQLLRLQHWDDVPETVREIIRRIEVRSATLRERIRDILELGDLKSSVKRSFAAAPVELGPLVAGVVGELAEKAAARNVHIDTALPPVSVRSDAGQIAVLLANLLSNAINYSHPGGRVAVAVEPGRRVCLRIADSGIGIGAEALPHIFEEYYSTREAAQMNRQSTGLGLSIAKQIAVNLDLDIVVDSEPETGTVFEVYFPEQRRTQDGEHSDH